jgi:hypothetical protein
VTTANCVPVFFDAFFAAAVIEIFYMKIPHCATALAAIHAAALQATSQPLALERSDKQSIFKKEPWDEAAWKRFSSESQGSRRSPWAWNNTLKHANGQPFLADDLTRYGYLPNAGSPTKGLPVGFAVSDGYLGPNYAACRVRQIKIEGKQ